MTIFYPERISGNPPIFFIFDENDLPDGYEIKRENSIPDNDYPEDECHCNIYGISRNRAKKWLKDRGREPKDMLICLSDGTYRPLTVADIS